jgi:hypothetical protein
VIETTGVPCRNARANAARALFIAEMAVQDAIPALPDDNACMSGNSGNDGNHGNSGNTSLDYLDLQPERRNCAVPTLIRGKVTDLKGFRLMPALPLLLRYLHYRCYHPVTPSQVTSLCPHHEPATACRPGQCQSRQLKPCCGSTWKPVPHQIVRCGMSCATALFNSPCKKPGRVKGGNGFLHVLGVLPVVGSKAIVDHFRLVNLHADRGGGVRRIQ